MSSDNVVLLAAPAEVPNPLTELLREGAWRLIQVSRPGPSRRNIAFFKR